MRRNRPAGPARRRDEHLELVLRERRPELAAGAPAVVGVDLDPVGPTADLPPHHPDDRLLAVGLLRALRRIERIVASRGPVAASGDNRAGDGEQPRARHDALLDGTPKLHVIVQRALGAEVALGRDAGPEGSAGMGHGPRHAEAERLLQYLIIP